MKKSRWLSLFIFVLLSLSVHPAAAHGVEIEYTVASVTAIQVTITARFESGEVMDACQATVYTPNDPENPWLVGECDDQGQFSFMADTTQPGTWEVQIRQAGHGEWVRIPIEASDDAGTVVISESGGTGKLSTGQIVLMSASVIWGFIGTGLYFSNRTSTKTTPKSEE